MVPAGVLVTARETGLRRARRSLDDDDPVDPERDDEPDEVGKVRVVEVVRRDAVDRQAGRSAISSPNDDVRNGSETTNPTTRATSPASPTGRLAKSASRRDVRPAAAQPPVGQHHAGPRGDPVDDEQQVVLELDEQVAGVQVEGEQEAEDATVIAE